MSSDRTFQLFVPTWDSVTFSDAVPALSEAGFVPEVLWEATVREARRLAPMSDDERVLKMWNNGKRAWFSWWPDGESWSVQLSLPMSWFERQHEDWRPRFVAIAGAFHATTVIVHKGEAGEDVIDVADDRDLARMLALESIAEVWVVERELGTAPFQVVGGYRLFRGEGRPYPHVR